MGKSIIWGMNHAHCIRQMVTEPIWPATQHHRLNVAGSFLCIPCNFQGKSSRDSGPLPHPWADQGNSSQPHRGERDPQMARLPALPGGKVRVMWCPAPHPPRPPGLRLRPRACKAVAAGEGLNQLHLGHHSILFFWSQGVCCGWASPVLIPQ